MNGSYIVQSLANGQLLISEQPNYLLGLAFLIPGLIAVGFFLYRCIRSRSAYPLFGVLIVAFFPIAGLRALNTGSLTLDRAANTALFHSPTKLWHDDFNVALSGIDHAEVRGGSRSDYVVVVMKNGDGLRFADPTQKTGKGRAAHAINEYIGSTGR